MCLREWGGGGGRSSSSTELGAEIDYIQKSQQKSQKKALQSQLLITKIHSWSVVYCYGARDLTISGVLHS